MKTLDLQNDFAEIYAFVADRIGIEVREDMLLLSAIPLCLPPFWLTPGKLLGRG